MTAAYQEFLASKRVVVRNHGRAVEPDQINPMLYGFQRDLTRWALRKGRAAIFADTGLGKSFMQLEWARLTGERTLILAPLAVAQQTVQEAAKLGTDLRYVRSQADANGARLAITNYEMASHFQADQFGAVVLDESSILKAFEGKTRTRLIRQFADTPLRLCCTATPAPNDIAELANHAEFLGIMSRVEMLATFFVHDDEGWRLKGHAREPFWRWLASWGMSLKRPSDLGYSDDGYLLPELSITPTFIPVEWTPDGQLFSTGLKGIGHRAQVRRATLERRVKHAAELVAAEPGEQWLCWVGLNDEQHALAAALPEAVVVEGKQAPEVKAERLTAFARGDIRVLITKPAIAGFGLNFQRCARQVFVGMNDSWEQWYQAIRRSWRFGQTRPVQVHVALSDAEKPIYDNVLRKHREAEAMSRELIQHVAAYEQSEVANTGNGKFTYATSDAEGETWRLLLGDSAERLTELPDESVDLSVFSPPFQSLYVYSPTERDLGNSKDVETFWRHYSFISRELLRVTKPGRLVCVHAADVPTTKAWHGVIGLDDFPGAMIRHMTEAGFIYHGRITIDKNPQAQAVRTKSKALLFVQLQKDASWLRPALADYVLVFRAPGDNQTPIHPDISNDDWIEWARPVWFGIRESDTLNVRAARSEEDERHICPLQLPVIERCVRLWSNPGETVLDPFAGIGSTLHEAVRLGRNAVGVELKESYFQTAVTNLRRVEAGAGESLTLFGVGE